MSAAAFFDAARAYKRELTGNAAVGLTQEEVDALTAVVAEWTPPAVGPCKLADATAFFAAIRNSFGALDQSQVDGFNRLLTAMGAARWPVAYCAYGLETAWHETARKMQPVEEAFWKDDFWRRSNLRYYPWHGRGDVQLTWERNYRRADDELGLKGALIADPRLALNPDISAKVLVHGMQKGWFTGKKLADYLPAQGYANRGQFKLARYIINGQDKAQLLADQAGKMQEALVAGGWA